MFELQTLSVMANEGNRGDALHAFDRCVTDSDYARWARRLGRHLCLIDVEDNSAELEEAYADADKAEQARDTLYDAADAALSLMEVVDWSGLEGAAKLDKAYAGLHTAWGDAK